MKIPALALTLRSLRIDNRSVLTYVLRFLLIAFLFVTLIFVQQEWRSSSAPGLIYFQFIVYIDFFAISIIGISFFSSVITEEKEEMTLGLLKMTGLNPISILLGKSASRLINGLFLLLAQLPFTLLAVTMGGVDQRQVLAAYVALTTYMIFLCGLAVLASTVSKRSRGAAPLTLTGLLAFFCGPYLGLGIMEFLRYENFITKTNPLYIDYQVFISWATDANVFVRIDRIMTSGYNGPIFLQTQPLTSLAFAAVFFGLAWILFNRFTRDDTSSAPPRGFFHFFKRKNRNAKYVGRAWNHAIEWHAFHFAVGGVSSAILRFLGLAVLFAIITAFYVWERANYGGRSGAYIDYDDIGNTIIAWTLMVIYGHSVLYAGALFQSEVREQTLSAIALTPISMGKIAYAKIRGSILALIPYFIWLGIGIAMSPDDFLEVLSDVLIHAEGWLLIITALFFLHVVAILSLYIKRGAVAVAIVLYMVAGFFIGMFAAVGGINDGDALAVILSFFQLIGCLAIHPWVNNRLKELAAQ